MPRDTTLTELSGAASMMWPPTTLRAAKAGHSPFAPVIEIGQAPILHPNPCATTPQEDAP